MTKRLAFMLAVALGACGGSDAGQVEYPTSAGVTVRSPQLIAVDEAPGVFTLADADEPVFYVDNAYWLYRDGRWYRSHSYDRDWVSVRQPPAQLREIREPLAYSRYQARRQEARNIPEPGARETMRDDNREQLDAPVVPPHQQPPLQPTEPIDPAQPNPMPDQQAPTPHDHGVTPTAPTPPAAPSAPGQLEQDKGEVDQDQEQGQGEDAEQGGDAEIEDRPQDTKIKSEKKRDY